MVVYVLCYGARINVFSVVVLFGDLPLSSHLELGIMFIVGAWGSSRLDGTGVGVKAAD